MKERQVVGDGWRWEGGRITDAARVWEQRGWGGPGRGKGERRVHLYLKSDPCFRGLVDRFVAVVDVSTPGEHGDASGDDNFALKHQRMTRSLAITQVGNGSESLLEVGLASRANTRS